LADEGQSKPSRKSSFTFYGRGAGAADCNTTKLRPNIRAGIAVLAYRTADFLIFSGTFLFWVLFDGFFGDILIRRRAFQGGQWRSFMSLFWMTAPVAWLYAIPLSGFSIGIWRLWQIYFAGGCRALESAPHGADRFRSAGLIFFAP